MQEFVYKNKLKKHMKDRHGEEKSRELTDEPNDDDGNE